MQTVPQSSRLTGADSRWSRAWGVEPGGWVGALRMQSCPPKWMGSHQGITRGCGTVTSVR